MCPKALLFALAFVMSVQICHAQAEASPASSPTKESEIPSDPVLRLYTYLESRDTIGYIDYVQRFVIEERESYPQDTLYHHLQQSLSMAEQIGDTTRMLWAEYNMVMFFLRPQDKGESAKPYLAFMKKMEKLPPNSDFLKVLAHTYSNYSNLGSLPTDSAIFYLHESIGLHPIVQDTLLLMLNHKNLARHYRHIKDWQGCIQHGTEAVSIARFFPGVVWNVENHVHLAACLIENGQPEEARAHFQHIQRWIGATRLEKEHRTALFVCEEAAGLAEKLGQYQLALQYHKQYAELLESELRQTREAEINKLKVEYETREKENQILTLELENERNRRERNQLLWFLGISVLAMAGLFAFYRFRQRYLSREARRLKELDAFKTDLYTNITHEFRTPLTVILGMAEQIRGQAKIRRLIRRNGQALLNLVNQMLDLRKLEVGALKLEMAQADAIPFLRYLCESFHSSAEAKDIQLSFHTDTDSLLMDYDPERLRQVVSNLLSNAIKFTPTGGKVKLLVATISHHSDFRFFSSAISAGEGGPTSDFVQLRVEDNGQGIPPNELDKIFDRFYQVDATATRKGEGTGIGLALAKELVEA
ncbi:MAG: tetratricopeptide repeat-containing sensor histidine kinase, partial [Phaeodactylibacter sp.]|nr:tetratricopeptide repeat-containing sensor histidine kinase [Phaeodactylibacter sp.]